MHLIPTRDEVVALLRKTGALREGHFEYSDGLHSSEYLQMPMAMRHYQDAKLLSVALSRSLRANSEIRAIIPQLSIVTPAPGGLPVAYGVCEALRARQVYWSDRSNENEPQRFRPFINVAPGEQVLLVDDILRTGRKLSELKKLVEGQGGKIAGIAVMLYQPNPKIVDFSPLPLFYLAKLDAAHYRNASDCEMCKAGVPVEKVEF